jgi:PhzF family phenazine biosynthesis protein
MKNTIEIHTVRAFTVGKEGGNYAGICFPENRHLNEEQMLGIAKTVGFSETVFLKADFDKKIFEARFFTSEGEVDICGHATIALFGFLRYKGLIKTGDYICNMKVGRISVHVSRHEVWMEQGEPQFFQAIGIEEINLSLGFPQKNGNSFYHPAFPSMIVSTGLRNLMIPLGSKEILLGMQPSLELITEMSIKYDINGYHCFALEQEENKLRLYARNFDPLFGIDEEAATGTSNGALLAYLYKYGIIEPNKKYLVEQGHVLNCLSNIYIKLVPGIKNKIMVGGTTYCDEVMEVDIPKQVRL